jgi:hypothetical protein
MSSSCFFFFYDVMSAFIILKILTLALKKGFLQEDILASEPRADSLNSEGGSLLVLLSLISLQKGCHKL